LHCPAVQNLEGSAVTELTDIDIDLDERLKQDFGDITRGLRLSRMLRETVIGKPGNLAKRIARESRSIGSARPALRVWVLFPKEQDLE
jgi:hypothetical protein